MALDLSFWKYEQEVNYKPYDVYISLSDGKSVAGVATLPIEEIKMKLEEALIDWEKLDDSHWISSDEVIELYTTDPFVRFDFVK